MPNRTDGALAKVTYASGVLRLIPHNSEGKAVLDACFAADSAHTTVAVAQEDAVMSGYGDTTQPYKVLKLTFS